MWKLTRNGTSYGKSAAHGRTEPDISSSHTKKVSFNQAVFSGRKIIPQTSKPGSDTNMAPGQSGADWTAKRKPYIPVVLSREEVDLVIGFMKYPHKLIISLMYGCGLRISECLSLRVLILI